MTHPNENGKQSIVEIFKHDGKYFVYGFANTDGEPSVDEKTQMKNSEGAI